MTGTFVKSFGYDIAKGRFGNDIAKGRFGNVIAKGRFGNDISKASSGFVKARAREAESLGFGNDIAKALEIALSMSRIV